MEEGVRHVLERLGNHTDGEAFELGKSAHPTGADNQLRSMYTQVRVQYFYSLTCFICAGEAGEPPQCGSPGACFGVLAAYHIGSEAFELGKSAHRTGADSPLRSMYTRVLVQ